jgi:hypothetical protein
VTMPGTHDQLYGSIGATDDATRRTGPRIVPNDGPES